MKISKAVKKALSKGCCITTKGHKDWIKIKPTNNNCKIFYSAIRY